MTCPFASTTRFVTLSTPHIDATNDHYDAVPISIDVACVGGTTLTSGAGIPTSNQDGNLVNDWDADAEDVQVAFQGTLTRRTVKVFNAAYQLERIENWSVASDAGAAILPTSYGYDPLTGRRVL